MYIDLIILLILLILVLMFFKRFSSFVFLNIIGKYIPENMFAIIDKYTKSIPTLCIILKWIFVIIMAIFLFYIIKIFIKRKKI